MSDRFRGKVVLVTGAGSGIGRATALAFAREGAAVAAADVSPAKAEAVVAEARAAGARALAVPCDVSRPEDCARAVRDTEAALGPLDILVNNAGIGASGTVLDHGRGDLGPPDGGQRQGHVPHVAGGPRGHGPAPDAA